MIDYDERRTDAPYRCAVDILTWLDIDGYVDEVAAMIAEHFPESKEAMIFQDCLGQTIKVGDVLACGQRRHSHGAIRVGIVRGFTERSILADMLDGDWRGLYHAERRDTSFTLRKGHFNAPYNCVVTGMSEDDLRGKVVIKEAA